MAVLMPTLMGGVMNNFRLFSLLILAIALTTAALYSQAPPVNSIGWETGYPKTVDSDPMKMLPGKIIYFGKYTVGAGYGVNSARVTYALKVNGQSQSIIDTSANWSNGKVGLLDNNNAIVELPVSVAKGNYDVKIVMTFIRFVPYHLDIVEATANVTVNS